LVALVLVATAGAQTIVMKVPVSDSFFSCTGDFVTLAGEQTLGSHLETDSAGGLHLKLSVENRGLQGLGTPSGKKYVGTDTSETETQIPNGAFFETTFENNVTLIRQGEDGGLLLGDDLRFKQLFHLTVNAQGIPTALKVEFKGPTCT
jgi:hypothetical protein